MRTPGSGLHTDNPAWPLLQALISFWGVTDADGAIGGTTIRCGALALEPSYANHALKILSGGASGQIRDITTHPAGTDTVTVVEAFSNAAGAAQQITAGTLFVILSKTPAIAEVAAVLASLGLMADAATADDLSNVTTTSAHAKLRRLLLRLSSDAFTATIQGAARTELDTMLYQLATYLAALGAAYSATVNPGAAAKTNIEQTLEDLGDVLAGAAGIVTFPAAAIPADGVSIAEVLRQIYNDVIALAGANIFHEQPDTAVNITAIAAGETNVLNLVVAATRYIVRSLRLKCADPGANTVTVRLYELVNDVLIVVDTFAIDATNFATYHSLPDMFGLMHLAGDNLRVTVQASAGGPYTVTGQISHATAT